MEIKKFEQFNYTKEPLDPDMELNYEVKGVQEWYENITDQISTILEQLSVEYDTPLKLTLDDDGFFINGIRFKPGYTLYSDVIYLYYIQETEYSNVIEVAIESSTIGDFKQELVKILNIG
jgi:hypothetical protein